jgi:hypothetical protein
MESAAAVVVVVVVVAGGFAAWAGEMPGAAAEAGFEGVVAFGIGTYSMGCFVVLVVEMFVVAVAAVDLAGRVKAKKRRMEVGILVIGSCNTSAAVVAVVAVAAVVVAVVAVVIVVVVAAV